MKKTVSFLMLALLAATTTLGTSSLEAQVSPVAYEGLNVLSALSPSIVLAGGYRQTNELLTEARKFQAFWDGLGLGGELESTVDTLGEVSNLTMVLAINDMNNVQFDAPEQNDPKNFCMLGRAQMSAELEKEMLADMPENTQIARMGGYTYMTSEGCLSNRDLNTQTEQVATLDSISRVNHNFYLYLNKEELQKQFMKSELYRSMMEGFSAEQMQDMLADGDVAKAAAWTSTLNTLSKMNVVTLFKDSKKAFVGVRVEKNALTIEKDVLYSNGSNAMLTNELFDAYARSQKLYLTPAVQLQVNTSTAHTTSLNQMTYRNPDASVLVALGSNVTTPLMMIGMTGMFMTPEMPMEMEEEYYHDMEVYTEETEALPME